jgi:hypothetical protein
MRGVLIDVFWSIIGISVFAVDVWSDFWEYACIQKVPVSNFGMDTEDPHKILQMSVLPRLVDSRPLVIPS